MKKLLAIMAGLVAVSVACAVAEEGAKEAKKAAKREAPPAKEITLTGTIAKVEKEGKAVYTLKTDDGVLVKIPPAAAEKVKDLVDAKVKVVGTGMEMEKNGKKMIALKTITSVEKVAAEAAAPAAAPAPVK